MNFILCSDGEFIYAELYPLTVDVPASIDWQAIKDAGIEFVIIKLGESENLDSIFIQHANNAVAVGQKIGVYYYARATSEVEAQQEANWVDAQINQYLNGVNPEMGIWYDKTTLEGMELLGATISQAVKDAIVQELAVLEAEALAK